MGDSTLRNNGSVAFDIDGRVDFESPFFDKGCLIASKIVTVLQLKFLLLLVELRFPFLRIRVQRQHICPLGVHLPT